MSRRIGDAVPGYLFERLAGRDVQSFADRVILVCTVDDRGFGHPALLSYFEVVATGPRTIRLAVYSDTRSAGNMRQRGQVTLVVVDEGAAYYVKGRVRELARSMRSTPYNAKFELEVIEVLVDEADQEREPGAHLASGIIYISPHRGDALARGRQVVAELQE